jgi:hypothetical protein
MRRFTREMYIYDSALSNLCAIRRYLSMLCRVVKLTKFDIFHLKENLVVRALAKNITSVNNPNSPGRCTVAHFNDFDNETRIDVRQYFKNKAHKTEILITLTKMCVGGNVNSSVFGQAVSVTDRIQKSWSSTLVHLIWRGKRRQIFIGIPHRDRYEFAWNSYSRTHILSKFRSRNERTGLFQGEGSKFSSPSS